ncbi:hypothetical protein F2Q69_00015241 [Brassica cretica]|uniref:Uncharacterized protein n=1 Tax=Brassica cretica TaxID=69181 RepID=A0A8S9R2M4_BRACR|nr:hypothetical protein F2Q69_00015241 [Brassica cretica]
MDLPVLRRRFAPLASHLHFKASSEFFETSVDLCAYLIDIVAGLGSILYRMRLIRIMLQASVCVCLFGHEVLSTSGRQAIVFNAVLLD